MESGPPAASGDSPAAPFCAACGLPQPTSASASGVGGLCLRCLARGFLRPEFSDAPAHDEFNAAEFTPDHREFGDFELLEELGRGGMGVVFRAYQRSLHRQVAVKFLLNGVLAGDAALTRFRVEAQTAARLRHPHVVGVHEIAEHRGRPYLVMELVRGQSLAQLLRDGPVAPDRAARWIREAALAAHYGHTHGIVHRDLKPSNVLIDEHGTARVTDFGLAKCTPESGALAIEQTPTLSGQVLGTPAYLSPEQAAAATDVDARTDVYALGGLLYHLLTGRPPFQGDSPAQILRQVAEADPVAPRSLLPSIPSDLETICLHCLEKVPDHRYASAAALTEDLERYQKGLPIAARPITRPGRLWRWCRRQPALASALAITVLLLVGIAGVSFLSSRRVAHLQRDTLDLLYASDMRLAQDSFEKGRWAGTRQLLDRHLPADGQPDRRGFEWWHLDDQIRSDAIATLGVHAGQAQRAAWSTDGRLLATAATDLRVWDTTTRRSLAHWQGSNYFRAVAFSPDQRRLAAAENTGGLVCYDLDSFTLLARYPGSNSVPFALLWRDADTLAVWSNQGRDRWSVRSNVVHREASLPAFSNRDVLTDSGLHLTGQRTPTRMNVWRDLTLLVSFPGQEIPFAFAGSADESRFALGEFSGLLSFFNRSDPEAARRVRAHQGLVNVLAFSPDGALLASGGIDGVVRIWDPELGRLLAELKGHRKPIWSIAFSPDGKRLASGDGGGEVKLWDTSTRMAPPALPDQNVVLASRDLTTWALQTDDSGQIEIRRAASPEQRVALVPRDTPAGRAVALSQSALVRADAAGRLTLDPLDGRSAAGALDLPPSRGPHDFVLDPLHRYAAYPDATSNDHHLVQFDPPRVITHWRHAKGDYRLLAFSPDGQWAALGNLPGSLRVLRLNDGSTHFERSAHQQDTYAAAFSTDGRSLATAGHDGRVHLWSTLSGAALATFQSTVETYWTLALSPDGSRLAAGTGESGVVLWNTDNQLEVAHFQLAPTPAPVEAGLAFAPDGTRLVSLFHGQLRAWAAPRPIPGPGPL